MGESGKVAIDILAKIGCDSWPILGEQIKEDSSARLKLGAG